MASVSRESLITLLGHQLICVAFLSSKAFSLEGGINLAEEVIGLVEDVSSISKLLERRHHQCPVCLGRLNSASNHLTKFMKFFKRLDAFPKACSVCMQ